jgi:hypothetical protein
MDVSKIIQRVEEIFITNDRYTDCGNKKEILPTWAETQLDLLRNEILVEEKKREMKLGDDLLI